MKERPILMSAPMVRALLDGSKTQTRRVVKKNASGRASKGGRNWHLGDPDVVLACPYGQAGDRLWVRETWRTDIDMYNDLSPSQLSGEETIIYEADGKWSDNHTVGRLRSSIHMPRWASRILLEITEVRVERLHNITPRDAMAEGVEGKGAMKDVVPNNGWRMGYRDLWESINGSGSWDANPWVWVVAFEVCHDRP